MLHFDMFILKIQNLLLEYGVNVLITVSGESLSLFNFSDGSNPCVKILNGFKRMAEFE
jgi:hypothetical protein